MRFPVALSLLLSALPAAVAQDLVAKTDALSPADEAKAFKLPAGFTAQLVAAEPDIQKPMQMAFDAKGRLWVTTSHHYPFTAEGGKGTDKLFVLSDFDATGKAKKVEVFDDHLNIPIGVLPLPDGRSVIVSECGKILKLTDTTGKGKANKREVLFDGFGFKDTHGMTNSYTLLPDGWVYACHGFANDSKVKGTDGHEVTMNSGHTFRFRPDGSRIEVFTRGQVNPFGMCVDPWLNLYTADCHSRPMTQLVRGAYYDSFGKPHDGLGYAPHVINHMHGSTGLCGLVYYAADHFPKEWDGVMFVGNVVTNRINCDRIEWKGSTPVGKELPDFLASDDPWFRPTDLKLGPDGALYVTDFYNKIVGHYEVDLKHPGRDKDRGRVWRIVWTGKDGQAPTTPGDLTAAESGELAKLLGHPNLTVRLLTTQELIRRDKPLDELEKTSDAEVRTAHKNWVNERLIWTGHPQPKLEYDPVKQPLVAAHYLRAVTAREEHRAAREKELGYDLAKVPPAVARTAVDRMTAHPHADFVVPLLTLIPTIPAEDTHLKHAAKIALRNCLDATDGKLWLVGTVGAKSEPGDFDPLVSALLGSADPRAAERLAHLLRKGMIEEDRAFEVGRRIGRYAAADVREGVASAIAETKKAGGLTWLRALSGLFRGLQEGGFKPDPKDGRYADLAVDSLRVAREAFTGPDAKLTGPAVELYREVRRVGPVQLPQVGSWGAPNPLPFDALRDEKRPVEYRALAAEVVALYDLKTARTAIHALLADEAVAAAARARLLSVMLANQPSVTDCGLARDAIKTAPYAQAVPVAVGLAGDKFGADLLLASVRSGDAPARLLQEKAVIDRLRATKVPDLDAKLKDLTKNLPPAEKRLDDLIKARAAGFPKAKPDAAVGKAVFTKNCAVCHQLNNEGAKVGPQLDGVGIRGLDRLLEDTLDPNRNVDQAFRATKLELKDGRTLTGLLLREEGAVYVLADSAGKEQRVGKDEVDKKATSNASAMPANLDTVMTEQEYYHLLAFLLEQKVKK